VVGVSFREAKTTALNSLCSNALPNCVPQPVFRSQPIREYHSSESSKAYSSSCAIVTCTRPTIGTRISQSCRTASANAHTHTQAIRSPQVRWRRSQTTGWYTKPLHGHQFVQAFPTMEQGGGAAHLDFQLPDHLGEQDLLPSPCPRSISRTRNTWILDRKCEVSVFRSRCCLLGSASWVGQGRQTGAEEPNIR
jgi:hypothetical protein